jgi:ubiquitin-conjugating enzyme E2 R
MSSAQKLLQNQFKSLKKEPVFGFSIDLVDESNIFEWLVYIAGPTETDYGSFLKILISKFQEGGIFQAILKFPVDYPYSPPSLQFIHPFWHPNVRFCRNSTLRSTKMEKFVFPFYM